MQRNAEDRTLNRPKMSPMSGENMHLPEYHHPGDHVWLKEQFETLAKIAGARAAESIAEKYSITYQDTHESEPVSIKKEGVARKEANTRLRQAIKTVRGKVNAPPAE